MPLPTDRDPDSWQRRGLGQSEDGSPEQGERSESFSPRRFEDEGYELVACPSCGTRNVTSAERASQSCCSCHARLDAFESAKGAGKLGGLFDRLTGIRKRKRRRLGFRRALAAFELEVDPNLHLEGDRLLEAMQEWIEENHTPWDRSNPRRKTFWGDHPFVRIGLVALAAVALVAAVLFVIRVKSERALAQAADPILPAIDQIGSLQDALPEEFEHARPAAESFLAASSVDSLLAVVRDRKRVEPLIRDYYASRSLSPIEHREITVEDAANYGGRIFLRLAAELPDGQFAGLTLERTERKYVVDWESFVGHSEVDWAKFKAGAPNAGQTVKVRAYASFVEQYHAPFEDPKIFQSIWLQSQDGQFLVGYTQRLGKACLDLRAKMDEAGKNRYEVIVRVRYPETDWGRDEVEIVEIVQTGWVEWDRLPAELTEPQL